MTHLELAQKALEHVKNTTFPVYIYASEGGSCGGGFDDNLELELSRAELLYLIHKSVGNDAPFQDQEEKETDVSAQIAEMAYESAWPDSAPAACVSDTIPDELWEIAEELESLDTDDMESIEEIQEELRTLSAGKYTFTFSIESDGFCLAEDISDTLELTANEVLGLLYDRYNYPEVFEAFHVAPLDEDFVNEKAEQLELETDYDPYNYGGYSDELDNYVDAWSFIINKIYKSELDEDGLNSLLDYFNDTDNWEGDITSWLENEGC